MHRRVKGGLVLAGLLALVGCSGDTLGDEYEAAQRERTTTAPSVRVAPRPVPTTTSTTPSTTAASVLPTPTETAPAGGDASAGSDAPAPSAEPTAPSPGSGGAGASGGSSRTSPTTAAAASAAESGPTYKVAFVAAGDVLNVRRSPGASSAKVGEIAPGRGGIRMTGAPVAAAGAYWAPIRVGAVSGWVNRHFLVADRSRSSFCADGTVSATITQLRAALAGRDEAAFARLVDPGRGVWVAVNEGGERRVDAPFLTGGKAETWAAGVAGSFAGAVVPRVAAALDGPSETTCGQPAPAGSGYTLPAGFGDLNYYAFVKTAGPQWTSVMVGLDDIGGRLGVISLVSWNGPR
ncbi:MAG: hypothetical protein ACKVWR_02690 [Acidimicrobiales bacterium]